MAKKKSKRVKSDSKLITVTGWAHADELLRHMADAQLAIQTAEAAAAETINEAKACLAIATKPHHEQIKILTLSLEAFATHSRHDLDGSLRTTFSSSPNYPKPSITPRANDTTKHNNL